MTTDSTPDIKTLVLDWTAAIERGDGAAAASYFAEDGVWIDAGTGMRCEGRAACAQFWSSGIFTEVRIEKTTFLVDGNTFANEWVMTGVHSGDTPGLPATGRSFRVVGAGIGEVRDGKITRATEYWNMADFLTQVGILPPPQA